MILLTNHILWWKSLLCQIYLLWWRYEREESGVIQKEGWGRYVGLWWDWLVLHKSYFRGRGMDKKHLHKFLFIFTNTKFLQVLLRFTFAIILIIWSLLYIKKIIYLKLNRKFQISIEIKYSDKLGLYSLRNHVKTKHEGFTYKCELCNLEFKDYNYRRKHRRSVHEGINKCKICNTNYSTKDALNQHYSNEHYGNRLRCVECGILLTTSESLRKHMASSH